MKFYLPKKFRTQHKSNRQASNTDDLIDPFAYPDMSTMPVSKLLEYKTSECLHAYETMIKSGVCREQARMILPQNMYTEYYGTCNLNNLVKFINLRSHEGAQWEIRKVAESCRTIAEKLWPVAMSNFMPNEDS